MAEDGDDGVAGDGDGVARDGDATGDRSRGHADRRDDDAETGDRTPRETVDELTDEDLTDIDEMEGISVESVERVLERGAIDRENALFVLLGVVLSMLVFLEFVSVLTGI